MSELSTSPPGARDLTKLLRGITLAALVTLILLGIPGSDLGREGVLGTAPGRAISTTSLEVEGWDDVLAHASEAPLTAVVSGRPPPVVVEPPRQVRAERSSTLRIRALEQVEVTLVHPEGTADTLRLEAGEMGAFLLRPFSPGWRSWRLGVAPDDVPPSETEWAALVRPARPVRVLAISGPPGPEPRAAMRALEESGEIVEAWTCLGRGMWVGRDGEDLPTDPAAYASFDVVVLFPGVAVSAASARALLAAVTDRGKGLLLAGATGDAPDLQAAVAAVTGRGAWSDEISVSGDTLTWRIPPEVAPLPSLPVATRMLVPTSRPTDDARSGHPALALGTFGRGRVGALALPDTWSWRMTAGAAEGHRLFWRDQVAWLAEGFREDPTLELLAADVRRGEQFFVRRIDVGGGFEAGDSDAVDSGASTASPTVHIRGPGEERTAEAVPLASSPAARMSLATFAPTEAGSYLLEGDGDDLAPEPALTPSPEGAPLAPDRGPALAVHVASTDAPALDREGRLARVALSSPGGSVVIDAAGAADVPDTTGPAWPWRAFLFSFLAVLLTAEWLRRRLSARP